MPVFMPKRLKKRPEETMLEELQAQILLLRQQYEALMEQHQRLEQDLYKKNQELIGKNQEVLALSEAFRNMAIKDGLTGLYNHRYFQETISKELDKAKRYKHPLSLVMTDVDKFKTFNDTYGHPEGDRVLKAVAATLQGGVRSIDLAARYGGEEFALVLPETSKAEAIIVAEKVRKSVESQRLMGKGPAGDPVTISLGVATFDEDGDAPGKLIQAADRRLYQAKKSGRNRVVAADA